MKVLSARPGTVDEDDIALLIANLGMRNVEEVLELARAYYPNKEVKPSARVLVEGILEAR